MGGEAELAGLRAQKILKFNGSLSMYSFCVLRLRFSASFVVFFILYLLLRDQHFRAGINKVLSYLIVCV